MKSALLSCAFLSSAHADQLDTYVSTVEKTGGWYLTESAVVSGTDVRAGVVYAIYDTSSDHLSAILRDYNRYGELIHFLSKSKIIESESATVKQVRMRAKILKGAIKLKARVKATETRLDARTVSFDLKKQKGNLKALDARFTVRTLSDTRSLVRIELLVDPDVWYVRDSRLSEYNQVNARRIARALKKTAKTRPLQPLATPPSVVKTEKPIAVPVDKSTTSKSTDMGAEKSAETSE